MTVLPFINILVFLLVIASLTKYLNTVDARISGYLFAFFFPTMLIIGLCLTSGVYMITTVQDREYKLRYLLNYGGMQSASYMLGITIADWIIFTIPCFLFTSLIWIVNIGIFKSRAHILFGVMMMFGIPFSCINNFVGFMFRDT